MQLPKTGEGYIARWAEWATAAYNDIIRLHSAQKRYSQLRKIVEENERLQRCGGHFLDWIFSSHTTAMLAGIRRHTSTQGSDFGVSTIVQEMSKNASLLTRERFMASWEPKDSYELEWAESNFESWGVVRDPQGRRGLDHISPAGMQEDARALLRVSRDVNRFSNARLMHFGSREPESIRLVQMNAALDEIGRVFTRYYKLLTHSHIAQLTPVDQFDALECFTFAWFEDRRAEGLLRDIQLRRASVQPKRES